MRRIGVFVAAMAVLLTSASCSRSNVAQDRLGAALSAFGFDAVHGKLLCDNGDGGHGLDNDNPWYKVYYEVDGTNDLDRRVRAVYNAAGYAPRQLPNPPDGGPYGYHPDQSDSNYRPPPTTTAYTEMQGGRALAAMITRDGVDPADCPGGATYPRPLTASHGRPVVTFDLVLASQGR